MSQVDRMDAIAAVHDFKVRVVVATDLASRGLDLANVNLVGQCSGLQSCVIDRLHVPS
jgi:superfamily II DNA/RNA helicase